MNRSRFQQLKNRQSSSAVGTSTGIVRLDLLVQTLLLELGVVGVTLADAVEVVACFLLEGVPVLLRIEEIDVRTVPPEVAEGGAET